MATITSPTLPRDLFPKQVPKNTKEARIAIAPDLVTHVNSTRLTANLGLYISSTDLNFDCDDTF